MTLIVETGTGLANAESYVSAADCVTYATARGLAFTNDAAGEQALRRATAWIDSTYRARFPGFRRNYRAQALEWPRSAVVDISGFPVPYDAVPIEIINATCEAAIREIAKPGALSPDIIPGKVATSLRAGMVEIQYAVGAGDAASQQPVSTLIDGILAPLLGVKNAYFATATRG